MILSKDNPHLTTYFNYSLPKPTVENKPDAIALSSVNCIFEYCHVDFAQNSEGTILSKINLLTTSGEIIALVGFSGAGKTTLVNLLPRFYDPAHGKILIDGIDIRDVTLNSLRKQIGIVPQETTMFSVTIAQNIAFGQA